MRSSLRPATAYTVAIGASSAASSTAVPSGITHVRLLATSACHVVFANTPVALSTSMMLAPNFPETFLIRPGEKVAVIQDAAAGTLSITEMTT